MPDEDLPESVLRVQEAIVGRVRIQTLRALLDGPQTFADLAGRLPYSNAGIRLSLSELAALGYVTDDSPKGRQRKATSALFTVDRDLVLRDLAELLVYLAR